MENIEKSRRKKFPVAQTILHVVLVFLLFIMLYPLAMALWNAFKSDIAYDYTRWYPTLLLRIRNVSTAFDMTSKYMLNTVVVGVAGTAGMLAISSLASFAFAKMKFPGRSFFLSMVLALMMVPGVLTLVPSYILYKTLGLHDNLMALILPIWTGGCIFAVFLLTTFFSGLPKELFEAAQIDGASLFRCDYAIALPLSMPILGTITIMQIVNVWNDYIWPQLVLSEEKFTVSAGLLLTFKSEYTSNMPVMFAGYLVASSPLILLFIFANKFYIQGLVGAAIKM
ncbi:MAG: carbohydrate ABC transporter permease [Candidatus Borkfalkia sp.]